MTHEQRIVELKKRIDEAKMQRAKLENQKENAEQNRSRLTNQMLEEFGISSLEEAKTLLVAMTEELTNQFNLVEKQLEEVRDGSKLSN